MSRPTAAVLAALERAAWSGPPADGLAALAGLDPEGARPERLRWLAGVCLGAVGRYREAAGWLAPGGVPAGSPAASCLASHLRQVGRHAEAEPLDRLALETAATAGARADALVGLVADAVGRHDLAAARERLAAARADIPTVGSVTADDTAWRPAVRLSWVTAEVALIADQSETAVRAARDAGRHARDATAWRHAVKSDLVLGASLYAAGRPRAAASVLRVAAAGAARLDLLPLVVVIRTLRAEILQVRAPLTAARERRRADSAQRSIEPPAEGCIAR